MDKLPKIVFVGRIMSRKFKQEEREIFEELYREKTGIAALLSPKKSAKEAAAGIEKLGTYACLPSLAPLLVSGEASISRAAIQKVVTLLEDMPDSEWGWLDEGLRRSFYRYSSSRLRGWYNLTPSALKGYHWSGEEATAALKLLSCHHSGYVREHALKSLLATDLVDVMPILFVRVNDWVQKVRLIAYTSLWERVAEMPVDMLIRYLILIDQLKARARNDHRELVAFVEEKLTQPGAVENILECVGSDNFRISRISYDLCDRLVADRAALLKRASSSVDSVVRVKALKLSAGILNGEDLYRYILESCNDRAPAIKKQSLYLLVEYFFERSEEQLRHFLMDKSSGIRDCAKFYLEKFGVDDIPEFYRTKLSGCESTASIEAILGLGEVGNQSDWLLVEEYLNHKRPKVRAAVIESAGKLKPVGYVDLLYQKLFFGMPSEVKAARKGLSDAGQVSLDRLKESDIKVSSSYQGKIVRGLITDCDKWDGLIATLEFTVGIVVEANSNATEELIQWFNRNDRSYWFVGPTSEQMARLNTLVRDIESVVDTRIYEKLMKLIRVLEL